MVSSAENLSRIKHNAEVGDSCALHKNSQINEYSNIQISKWLDYLFIGLFVILVIRAQRAGLVGERSYCSEVGL